MVDQDTMLEFADDDTLAGFRLHRLEIYNWGTFDGRIWVLPLGGRNGLLTGEIGSGKSTVVDAINTLLVPPSRVAFNRAAGANRRERDLRSYVLGYHRSERTAEGSSVRPVALRDRRSYSVILAVFHNEGFEQTVTLAQVFWQKDGHGQPARFYVVSDRDLAIQEAFSDFGSDISRLRRRIRTLPHTEPVFDSYPPYSAAFRRRFGLQSEQALMLFHQTVSMKSVGNLTDFVREHMLEPFAVAPRIEALLDHTEDLYRAHEAVLRAKDQVRRLGGIETQLAEYNAIVEQEAHLRFCRDGLRVYFADHRRRLLEERIQGLNRDREKLTQKYRDLDGRMTEKSTERDRVKQQIAENGGNRLELLRTSRVELETEKKRRVTRYEEYRDLALALNLPDASDANQFVENRNSIQTSLTGSLQRIDEAQNGMTERGVALKTLKHDHETVSQEIQSLRNRRSNIDSRQIAIRNRICETLGCDEQRLPFAGELLQVREGEREWEGAMERVLHSFGLSLLVPADLYGPVSDWVDLTNLRGRLVYYRVREEESPRYEIEPDDNALFAKVEIKPDTPLSGWLRQQLERRYDYTCCRTMSDFRRANKALTRAGQIKGSPVRHEKDDRHAIDDRSRYILGWSNEAKIRVLDERRAALEQAIAEEGTAYSKLQETLRTEQNTQGRLYRLEAVKDFAEIDWQPIASHIEEVSRDIAQLEASSNILRTLSDQLAVLETQIEKTGKARERCNGDLARNDERRTNDTRRLEEDTRVISSASQTPAALTPEIDVYRGEAIGDRAVTIENADARQQELREWLQGKIDAAVKQLRRLGDTIIGRMQDFQRDYVVETQEVDVSIEAGAEYLQLLNRLRADDLPRFEARFKTLLNENTIREIANFQAQLNKESGVIAERVEAINRSLASIEYESGRYIRLEALPAPDQEIRSFRHELRNCTAGTIGGSQDEQYTEAKFEQVKAIIDRFRGREGTAESDRRWTQKVTDVRSWYVFAASVRWCEDDSEYEHYTDSSGKSGGQKEKLAYTVLAASVAYQFGLEWGETRSRSFRCVVIDEAFGRGSDESARFALELFKQLNLQLLIVTPLQKIHIIEPYVSTVGFVHNEGGKNSVLRCLTIEEFRAERASYTDTARTGASGDGQDDDRAVPDSATVEEAGR